MKNDIEQRLKESLQKPFVNAKTFLKDIIFPVFGEDMFNDDGMYEVLHARQELKPKAVASGIISIKGVGSLIVEGSQLDIFDITLDAKKQLQRNRVEIQQIVRSIISTHSGAFIIFHYQSGAKWEWRFTFCHKGASQLDASDAKRYTFLLGPGQSCRTAAENFMKIHEKIESEGEFEMDDIIKAFDVEALSKEFFGKYKEKYEKFCSYIYNNRYDETKFGSFFASCEDKFIRDYVKKLLGRLVFLQFLQKKGWLGASSCEWNDGDRDFLQHLFENASKEQKDDFLDTVLEPMFEKALDGNRAATNYDYDTGVKGFRNVKIPYLNGGLYSKDAGIDDAKSVFPATYFEELFTFFYQYNFTIDENDPNDAEVGIDPEMLGRIFENLLEDNKDKGAFYTPKTIVQYMCKESLIAYLQNGCCTDRARNAARYFVETHDAAPLRELHMEKNGKKTDGSVLDFFDKMLKNVKICDPAIGSGAFPMGLLRELYACRAAIEDFETTTPAEIKKEIIQNNIYGVDIEKGAVDIARLRFWLSLILDEEDPKALPNLDFKIMQGNSLLESFHGVDLSNIAVGKQNASKALKVNARTMQGSIFFQNEQEAMKEIQKCIRRYYSTDSHSAKQMLYAKIESASRQYLYHLTEGRPELQAEVEELPLCNDQFFLWHTFFADVFEQGGFDIVIGNPPYIQLQKDSGLLADLYKDCGFETFDRMGDIYCLFYEHGFNLLKEKGVLCYITSNKWMRTGYGEKTRAFIKDFSNPLILIDFIKMKLFDDATVETNVLLLKKESYKNDTKCASLVELKKEDLTNLVQLIDNNSYPYRFDNTDFWVLSDADTGKLKNKIKSAGVALRNWGLKVNFGIKTGFNDAFIITTEQKDEILSACVTEEEHERTEAIIQPVVRGKDVGVYQNNWVNMWLICTFPAKNYTIDNYPSLKNYLLSFGKERLEQSGKKYKDFSARKKTHNDWFETQDQIGYWKELEKPKIIWKRIGSILRFAYDEDKSMCLDSTCFATGEHVKFLCAIFNSKLGHFMLQDSPKTGTGDLLISVQAIEPIVVPIPTPKDKEKIEAVTDRIISAKKFNPRANTFADEQEIDRLVYDLYGLTEEEIAIVEGIN